MKLYTTHGVFQLTNNCETFVTFGDVSPLAMAAAVSFVGIAGMYAWTGKSRTKRLKVTATG